jgi:hypothetical protein
VAAFLWAPPAREGAPQQLTGAQRRLLETLAERAHPAVLPM